MRHSHFCTMFLLPALLLAGGISCEKKPSNEGQIDPRTLIGGDFTLEQKESFDVVSGVKYTKYLQDRLGATVHVLSLDMESGGFAVEASFADGICPNPCDESANNGKKLRETLSENIARRTASGENIVAGINGDYYSTLGGFPLSCHIEDGEPVFVNNPYELSREPFFVYGLSIYKDGTFRFGERKVSMSASFGGKTVSVYSVNDTIVALHPKSRAAAYKGANIYTYRFREQPFASKPSIVNKIGTQAKFIVARTRDGLKINEGEQEAEVLQVLDGIHGSLTKAPYVSDPRDFVLQLTGNSADALTPVPGDRISVKLEMSLNGEVKPIAAHMGGKYLYVKDGKAGTGTDDPHAPAHTSVFGCDKEGRHLMLVCIAGSMSFYDHYKICLELGMYQALKVDGGGSTEMWVKKNGNGTIICPSTDSRGNERSNMNYLLVRQL